MGEINEQLKLICVICCLVAAVMFIIGGIISLVSTMFTDGEVPEKIFIISGSLASIAILGGVIFCFLAVLLK